MTKEQHLADMQKRWEEQQKEKADMMAQHKAISDKIEALENAGRDDEANALLQKNRWIMSYDAKGNYTGPVSYENGWTA